MRFFPARHLGVPRRHQRLGLWGLRRRLGPSLESCEGLLGCLEFLVRVSQASAKGERIALDDLMDDMEEIRHTQALQPLFGELDQGLGSVTDQVQDLGSQGREPLHPPTAFHVA